MPSQVHIRSDHHARVNLEGKEQRIFHTLYRPEGGEVKATLLILHGMQEHSGRYQRVATYFAERGFAVLTYDHIGHGHTAATPKEHGYFLRWRGVEQLVGDARTMGRMLADLFPDRPHFLLGHSMGSFIARCLLQESSAEFSGAVIVGTGGRIPGIGLAKAWLGLLNFLAPRRRSAFINNTFSRMNNRHFRKEPGATDTSWLSVDQANREAFVADPLNGIPFTHNGFYTLVSVNQRATRRHWAKTIDPHFPLLFVSGADDPIGNFGKGVRQTVKDLEQKGHDRVSLRLHPGMRHEILNEGIREEVFGEVYGWLSAPGTE